MLAHGRNATSSDRMEGHFVHPFDDDRFISGNGTIGLEIVEDLPDVDAVIAPIGGGGLLAGAAIALKALRPGGQGLRGRTGDRRAAGPLARRGAASDFAELDLVVRRRRRRPVGARDDVAAAAPLRGRVDRRAPGRGGAGDGRWSPSACTSSPKAPPAAPSPPRCRRLHREGTPEGRRDRVRRQHRFARFAPLVGACA